MVEVYTLNAFSKSTQGGNPAGVVLDAVSLSEDHMQNIANELGYSETAFLLSSLDADFRIRFFTPNREIDLCGHAIIATFVLLSQLNRISQGQYNIETKAGLLSVDVLDNTIVFMTQNPPIYGDFADHCVIADSLNIPVDYFHPDLRPQIISTGLRDIIIPIRSQKLLLDINPDFSKITLVSEKLGVVGYHLFSLETLFNSTAHCRNFAPLYEIPEEAATGTSNGALSCYLFAHGVINAKQKDLLVFEQGYSMGRPSEIQARLAISKGAINKVEVGGTACLVSGPVTF